MFLILSPIRSKTRVLYPRIGAKTSFIELGENALTFLGNIHALVLGEEFAHIVVIDCC